MHKYQLFNLLVESQLNIPLLEEAEETHQPIDATIQLGKIPPVKGKILYEDEFNQLAKEEYCLKVDDVADYYVANGNYICIDPHESLNKGNITLFLLGSILGVLLAQRGAVILHSSSIVINDKAVLFCGDCGAGKSTTATAFRLRGYPLLSDDINLLKYDFTSHVVNAYRGFPQQKLCEDAMLKLGVDSASYKQVSYAKGKYITSALDCFHERVVPVKAIYELSPCAIQHVQLKELKGKEKLISLMKNLFRLQVRYYTGTSATYMKRLIQIAESTPYFVVSRPTERFCINEVIEEVLLNSQQLC